mgnify:CR=1 FL=1
MDIQGKVFIVTGGASGLGAESARRLAREGAKVMLTDVTAEAGQAAAWEKVTWGQLVIVPRRRVPYAPIDPAGARDLLIHAALVEEQFRGDPPFLAHNRALRERIEALERHRQLQQLLAAP